MMKECFQPWARSCSAALLATLIAGALIACSGARNLPAAPERLTFESPLKAPRGASVAGLQKLWTRKLTGYLSELSVSANGEALLIASIPNHERPEGDRQNLLHYVSGTGRELWRKVMPTQIKTQAISADGALVLAATHDDQILAFDQKGKALWTVSGTCTPIILEKPKKILCYHDDDAEPQVAFDVYDWKGAKLQSYPIQHDVLALKVSEDQKSIAVALTEGQVQLVSTEDFKLRWQAQVEGELVDVDVSSGERPRVVALYSNRLLVGHQRLQWLDFDGKRVAEIMPKGRADQVKFGGSAPDAFVFLYGNGEGGQYVSAVGISATGMNELWFRGSERNAHYTPQLFAALRPAQLIFGFEEVNQADRQSYLISMGPDGGLLGLFEVKKALNSDEGSYLYAQSWAAEASRLAIATDDGSLGYFQAEHDLAKP